MKSLVGKNTLVATTQCVTQDIEELKGKQIINKTSHAMNITRMEQTLVPVE
jgi:hypothetical protein